VYILILFSVMFYSDQSVQLFTDTMYHCHSSVSEI